MRNPFVYYRMFVKNTIMCEFLSFQCPFAPRRFSFLSHFYIITMLSQDVGEKSTIPFFVHLVIRWKFINLHPATF